MGEITGYQIHLKDTDEGGEHGSAFFSLSADFDFAHSRGKTVQDLVDELLNELFQEHGQGYLEPWGDLTYLPAGIRLPDAPLTHRRELKDFLETHYGRACCIGWIYS